MTETQVSAEMIEAGINASNIQAYGCASVGTQCRAVYLAMRQADPARGVGEAVEALDRVLQVSERGDISLGGRIATIQSIIRAALTRAASTEEVK